MSDSLLADYNDNIIRTIKKYKKDYVRLICAYEGEGKSLFASNEALYFNSEFDVKTQTVYSLEQFLDFQDMYKDDPGKVCIMDEAVLQLLGDDNNTKEAKLFKKLFVTHRNKGHIYLLCSPSPWLMMPYIRKWRIRDCVLIYTDQETVNLRRRVAYYTKKAYSNFITQKHASDDIITPYHFVRTYEPSDNFPFEMITDKDVLKLYAEMDIKKTETQDALRLEARKIIAEDASAGEFRLDKKISRISVLYDVINKIIDDKLPKRRSINSVCEWAGITKQTYYDYQNRQVRQRLEQENILVTA